MVKNKQTSAKTSKLTKKPAKLTAEEQFEQSETRFWKEVEERSKDLIANLIENNLPISAISKNFDLEKDVEYRMILRDYTPQSYADNEEYQSKITSDNWTEDDVEYVAQEVALWYFHSVMKGIITDLSEYSVYESHYFANLTDSNY